MRVPSSITAFVAMFLVIAPGCSSSSEAETPPPVVALYEGQAELAPFPSDHFRTGGRLSLSAVATTNPFARAWTTTVPQLEALDGFSTIGGAFVRFSDELEVADLVKHPPQDFTRRGELPVGLVDLDADRLVPIVVRYFSWNEDGKATAPDYTLVVEPATPLSPKTRHLLVIGDTLRAKTGAKVEAAPAMRALVLGDAEGEYGVALRAALPAAERLAGIAKDHVASATMFTTASVHDEVATIARATREAPAPATTAPKLGKRATDAGDARVRFTGTFPAPEYRAADGKFRVDGGKPQVQRSADLEYYLTFTNGNRSGPRPIVIFGHGLGRDRDMSWEIGQQLAELDIAILSIDAPLHGSRHVPPFAPGQTDQVSSTLEFIGVNLGAKAIDIGLARDNFRQLASDQLQLFRMASALGTLDVLPAGAPDGTPDVDPTRVFYMGVSFGAVVGPTVLAFVPEARSAVLTVGGAPLGTILRDSQTLRVLLDGILPEGATESDLVRFIAIAQGVIDSGDPVNYAPFVMTRAFPGVPGWRGTDVLLQEAIHDTIIPNTSSTMLARALGVTQIDPVLEPIAGLARAGSPLASNGGAPVGGVLQLDRAGGEPVNHRTFHGMPEVKKQYVDFLRSALEAPRPSIK